MLQCTWENTREKISPDKTLLSCFLVFISKPAVVLKAAGAECLTGTSQLGSVSWSCHQQLAL